MNNEILWLLRLGLDQKLFTRDQALTILRVLGREVALMDFAQKLIDAGKYGASDLHLSAGSKPFVRKHRVLTPITEHILTDKESLRLNTVLLAEHQKKIFLERRDYDLALALGATSRYRVNLMFHK